MTQERTSTEDEPTLELRLDPRPRLARLTVLPSATARRHVVRLRGREARDASQSARELVDGRRGAVQAARELRVRS